MKRHRFCMHCVPFIFTRGVAGLLTVELFLSSVNISIGFREISHHKEYLFNPIAVQFFIADYMVISLQQLNLNSKEMPTNMRSIFKGGDS